MLPAPHRIRAALRRAVPVAACAALAWACLAATLAPGSAAGSTAGPGSLNAHGIPVRFTRVHWGWRPSSPDQFFWGEWSYPDYPLACTTRATPRAPAYQLLWVQDAAHVHADVETRHPQLVAATIRRAVSVFAASRNIPIRTAAGLRSAATPRLLTEPPQHRGDVGCAPSIKRVTVPHAVVEREVFQNWTNPATGHVERGLFAYLEHHGFPADNVLRYVVLADTPLAADYRQGIRGETIVAADGSQYGPNDSRPGPENRNNAGGTWSVIFTNGTAADFSVQGDLGPAIAHELIHSGGAELSDAPHANRDNPAHPSDCADLLCYNDTDVPGQTYNACPAAAHRQSTPVTWTEFTANVWSQSRPAYRLDCGKNDYFAWYADGSGRKPWSQRRWAASSNRFWFGNQGRGLYTGPVFTNPVIAPSCLWDPVDGYCPPGVTRPSGASRGVAAAGERVAVTVRSMVGGLQRATGTPAWRVDAPGTERVISRWVAAVVRSR